MTKNRSTKRALLLTALAIVTCVAMLVGSTFAWFTDSVTSSGNIIKSGTLDVTLEWFDGTKAVPAENSDEWKDASTGAIFDYSLWEPGFTQVRHIKVANEGTLALKYQISIVANGEVSNLADVIDVYYVDPAVQVADRDDLTESKKLGTLTQVLAAVDTEAAGVLKAGENDTITIALKMQEAATNEYQDKAIGASFSVQLQATQYTFEEDSFDDQYDDIQMVGDAAELKAALAEGGNILLAADVALDADETLTVPAGKEATIDLNGKAISAVSDKTGSNRNAFDVRGELTVRNGTVTTKHEGANMGWGYSTNVFNVTAGGVLNLEDANISNLGGSDMAFVVHLNNWGEVTLNVDNCVLTSNYAAVRVFNSGYDMNNVTITNSTLEGGSMSFWVHNATVEDFGTAEKAAVAAERLNFNFIVEDPDATVAAGDVSNLVAEANNTFIGKIRYGFTNGAIYYLPV